MVSFVFAAPALALQAGPLPPTVSIIQFVPGERLSAAGRSAIDRLLTQLEPSHLRIQRSDASPVPLVDCFTQKPAVPSCLYVNLARQNAPPGQIALAVWETDGALPWPCVGRNQAAFAPDRQEVVAPLAELGSDIERGVPRGAGGCLTATGTQSGW